MSDGPAVVYLGLGSNMGDRAANIREALKRLHERAPIETVSSLYETPPVGYTEQPHFLNAVCKATTELSPEELLHVAKEIERAMLRTSSFRNAPRPIDIDILFYNDLALETERLVIPHAAMHQRAFVLVPLGEIDPCLVHPVLDVTVRELLARAEGAEDVVKIDTLRGPEHRR
jgi:2-amino-4-hydroxy-6-hydroxymethyldihydropteridine diphosphokinase